MFDIKAAAKYIKQQVKRIHPTNIYTGTRITFRYLL